MQIEFQGRMFTVHPNADETVFKVMYLNKTRNIAGHVSAQNTDRLRKLLEVQSRCCRNDDGADTLVPRP